MFPPTNLKFIYPATQPGYEARDVGFNLGQEQFLVVCLVTKPAVSPLATTRLNFACCQKWRLLVEMGYTKIDSVKEVTDYRTEVEEVKKWWTQPRFRNTKRYAS